MKEVKKETNAGSATDKDGQAKELAILLHGILRSNLDMMPLEKYLSNAGYETLNIMYPSRQKSLEDLTDYIHEKIIAAPTYSKSKKINFVTHSMGGLITRYYIECYRPPNLGKVVMMGPPNSGSEFADWLTETKLLAPLFEAIYGPAGQQLTTNHKHIDKKITYPLGIIAGNKSINPLAPWILTGEHDGMVPIERTKIEGMKYHIIINATHSFMMFNKEVMHQVIEFLKNSHFDHDYKQL